MIKKQYISGIYKQQYKYKSFSPSLINKPFDITDNAILELLEEACRFIWELNAFSSLVPDVDYFIEMHIKKEANTSSKIEWTQTTFNEILLPESEITPERKNDYKEVKNYIDAMNFAIDDLKQTPLSFRLLKTTHKILLSDVRGENKNPWEIRKSQNWIWWSSLKDAFFIPPHNDEVPDLISDLEKFWHNDNLQIPHLIRIALSHYQFETIHPFLDWNWRIWRLLITLYLTNFKILDRPALYLSDFFEKNKSEYYNALTLVRTSNNIEHWIKFFLVGVIETSKKWKNVLQNIINLRKKYEEWIEWGIWIKKQTLSKKFLLNLFSSPVVSIRGTEKKLLITFPTASALIEDFVRIGLLKEKTGMSRDRIFELTEYINLFNDLE